MNSRRLIRSPRRQRRRHGEAQRPGGVEVDDKLEFGRLLNGQIGWLGTLEDFIDGASGAAKSPRESRPGTAA